MTDTPAGSAAGSQVLLFETTHHALWAEDVALEHGIPAEVVPAPAEARSKCGLALQTLVTRIEELEEALTAAAIPFERL